MMERLAAADGQPAGRSGALPTAGRSRAWRSCSVRIPGRAAPAYCSSVCCLASLKQARYVRAANPASRVYVFYIDIRTPGSTRASIPRRRRTRHRAREGQGGQGGEGPDGRWSSRPRTSFSARRSGSRRTWWCSPPAWSQPEAARLRGEAIRLDEDGFAPPTCSSRASSRSASRRPGGRELRHPGGDRRGAQGDPVGARSPVGARKLGQAARPWPAGRASSSAPGARSALHGRGRAAEGRGGRDRIPVCRTHPFLCSEDGVNLLKTSCSARAWTGCARRLLVPLPRETFDFAGRP